MRAYEICASDLVVDVCPVCEDPECPCDCCEDCGEYADDCRCCRCRACEELLPGCTCYVVAFSAPLNVPGAEVVCVVERVCFWRDPDDVLRSVACPNVAAAASLVAVLQSQDPPDFAAWWAMLEDTGATPLRVFLPRLVTAFPALLFPESLILSL